VIASGYRDVDLQDAAEGRGGRVPDRVGAGEALPGEQQERNRQVPRPAQERPQALQGIR